MMSVYACPLFCIFLSSPDLLLDLLYINIYIHKTNFKYFLFANFLPFLSNLQRQVGTPRQVKHLFFYLSFAYICPLT
jgi:hypothetical protein